MSNDANIRNNARLIGKTAYEASVREQPTYHDGTRRKTWDELRDLERWSWTRPLQVDGKRAREQ